jgi:hypothetical protein
MPDVCLDGNFFKSPCLFDLDVSGQQTGHNFIYRCLVYIPAAVPVAPLRLTIKYLFKRNINRL